jgi:hypothetical protein
MLQSALCMVGTGDTQTITDDLIRSLELHEFMVLWVDKRPKTQIALIVEGN